MRNLQGVIVGLAVLLAACGGEAEATAATCPDGQVFESFDTDVCIPEEDTPDTTTSTTAAETNTTTAAPETTTTTTEVEEAAGPQPGPAVSGDDGRGFGIPPKNDDGTWPLTIAEADTVEAELEQAVWSAWEVRNELLFAEAPRTDFTAFDEWFEGDARDFFVDFISTAPTIRADRPSQTWIDSVTAQGDSSGFVNLCAFDQATTYDDSGAVEFEIEGAALIQYRLQEAGNGWKVIGSSTLENESGVTGCVAEQLSGS